MADYDSRALAEQITTLAMIWIGHTTTDQFIATIEPIISAALHAAYQAGRDEAIKLMVDAALSARAEEHKANG